MIRGTAVWIDLSDASPPEMEKRRPAVIVSNSIHNMTLDSVVVDPLSSRPPEIPPLRIRVHLPGLKDTGFAVIPGIRQVKKSRILRAIGDQPCRTGFSICDHRGISVRRLTSTRIHPG